MLFRFGEMFSDGLASIFRAAWRCLVEVVLADLWGCLSQVGIEKSPGLAAVGRAFLGPVGLSSRRVTGVGVLGEGGADPVPGGGDRRCPAPGGVDAQPELSGAAGDAGGDV